MGVALIKAVAETCFSSSVSTARLKISIGTILASISDSNDRVRGSTIDTKERYIIGARIIVKKCFPSIRKSLAIMLLIYFISTSPSPSYLS